MNPLIENLPKMCAKLAFSEPSHENLPKMLVKPTFPELFKLFREGAETLRTFWKSFECSGTVGVTDLLNGFD